MGIAEGVDVEDVDVGGGEEEVLEELLDFSIGLQEMGMWIHLD